ncbi:MAG: tRNA1(Val) (adenine(37)-N6)-methyltransferase [Oscillospiraceae bacterium]|nr:MAG: tRNA1(Val) (adenine(37)-N6)-methyltransferase [Oscillospiraceae bacterium]
MNDRPSGGWSDEPQRMILAAGISVFLSRRHRFGTDTVLLSRFAQPRAQDRCVELGAGCGAATLLWFAEGEPAPARVVCVELDGEACGLLGRGVSENGLAGRITALRADLRCLAKEPDLPAGGFDLVICNPPYFACGEGIEPEDPARRAARQEATATIGEVTAAAARLLRFRGRFCCCWKPQRLPDLFEAMRAVRLEPKRLRPVCTRAGEPPELLLVEAVLGGGKQLNWLPALVLLGPDGEPGEEYRAIYRMEE